MDALITTLLIVALFALLGSGVWIGLALFGVAWIGMELFSSRPAGDAMAVTIWGTASSWTLTALPLFVWMGEILFRTRLSEDMFKGLAPWLERVPGRLLHTNIIGCTIFAAVSGSSAATCATIGKMTLPELKSRGYPEDITIGTLAFVRRDDGFRSGHHRGIHPTMIGACKPHVCIRCVNFTCADLCMSPQEVVTVGAVYVHHSCIAH
jgi:TRAP-type mannitol/chloroaromatic compound transport system permease large subunit